MPSAYNQLVQDILEQNRRHKQAAVKKQANISKPKLTVQSASALIKEKIAEDRAKINRKEAAEKRKP